MTAFAIGSKVRTTYYYSETGKLVKPRVTYGEGVPGPGWHMIRFDSDGRRACIHQEMMVLRNDG